jgi:hypothetical protein
MNWRTRKVVESRLGSPIVETSIRDVKPADAGMRDESWYVFQTADGRYHTYSDCESVDQVQSHASLGEALNYWDDAAEVDRSAH